MSSHLITYRYFRRSQASNGQGIAILQTFTGPGSIVYRYKIVRGAQTIAKAKAYAEANIRDWDTTGSLSIKKWIGTCWIEELFDFSYDHPAFSMDDEENL